jgi:hypothetical protein
MKYEYSDYSHIDHIEGKLFFTASWDNKFKIYVHLYAYQYLCQCSANCLFFSG